MVTFATTKTRHDAMQTAHRTILAIGSNHEPETNISLALSRLEEIVPDMRQSRTLQTEALDGATGTFCNMMLSGHTALTLEELTKATKEIERLCGRKHGGEEVSMDIDIMDYDGQRLHQADWQRNYIKTLIKEV